MNGEICICIMSLMLVISLVLNNTVLQFSTLMFDTFYLYLETCFNKFVGHSTTQN